MDYLYKETDRIQEEDWCNIRENYLDDPALVYRTLIDMLTK